jgi:uncharacterized protein with HEPN domain
VRLLEILGEAANRVPQEEQARLSDIAWPEIVAPRNRLIHGYDSVDLGIVWRAIRKNLPDLVDQLEAELGAGGG